MSPICRRLSCSSCVFVSFIIVLVACPNVIVSSTLLYLHFIHKYLYNDTTSFTSQFHLPLSLTVLIISRLIPATCLSWGPVQSGRVPSVANLATTLAMLHASSLAPPRVPWQVIKVLSLHLKMTLLMIVLRSEGSDLKQTSINWNYTGISLQRILLDRGDLSKHPNFDITVNDVTSLCV